MTTYTIGRTLVSQERFSEFSNALRELFPTRTPEIQRAAQDNHLSTEEISSYFDYVQDQRFTIDDLTQNPLFRTPSAFSRLNDFFIFYPESELSRDVLEQTPRQRDSSETRSHAAYVWAQAHHQPSYFLRASPEIRANASFASQYLSEILRLSSPNHFISVFKKLPEAVRSDAELVRRYAFFVPGILLHVGEALKGNRGFWEEILRIENSLAFHLPPEVQTSLFYTSPDKQQLTPFFEILLSEMIIQDPSCLTKLPIEIRSTPSIIEGYINLPRAVKFINPELLENHDFLRTQARQHISILFHLPNQTTAQSIWEQLFDELPDNSFGPEFLRLRDLNEARNQLRDYGIECPERIHSLGNLLRLLEMQSRFRNETVSHQPIMTIFTTPADHNGAFSQPRWLDQLIESGYVQIYYREIRSELDLSQQAQYLEKQSWIPDYTIIGGHGLENVGLYLYEGNDGREILPEEIIRPEDVNQNWVPRIIRKTRRQVFWFSCHGGVNFVKPFSQNLRETEILGPDRATNIHRIFFAPDGRLQVDWEDHGRTLSSHSNTK